MQVYPQNDTFDDSATPYDGLHAGWLRVRPWTADAGSGDAIVTEIGSVHEGYTDTGQTVPRAAVIGSSSPVGAPTSSFLWRPQYLTTAIARLGLIRVPIPTLGLTSFRFALVGVRAAGQTIDDSVPGAEHLKLGEGYWLVMRNVALQPGAKFMLLRVNAGVTTKLTETAVVDISTLPLPTGMVLSLQATTVGATVVLSCKRTPDSGSTTLIDIFGADVVDSSGSRLTAAGRCGFGLVRPTTAGTDLSTHFEIENAGVTVFRDEWRRANVNVGTPVGGDLNGRAGLSLQPYFGGSIGGYTVLARKLARDAGSNRAKNQTGSLAWDCPMSVAAPHPSIQRRWGEATFPAAAGGITDTISIEVRGTRLNGDSRPLDKAYQLQVACTGGSVFVAILASYVGGVRTQLATKALSGPVSGTPVKIEIETFNTGGATDTEGTPNLILRIDNVILTGWTLAGVSGITENAAGTILDTRSAAIRQGWEHAHRYLRTGGVAGTVLFDNWNDTSVVVDPDPPADPDPPPPDLTPVTILGETAGVTGTLVLDSGEWNVDVEPSDPGIKHGYDSDHGQTFAIASRVRRRWRISNRAVNATRDAYILAFFDSHKGCEIPFYWATEDGDTAIFVFTTPDLPQRMRSAYTFTYEFGIEERFAT